MGMAASASTAVTNDCPASPAKNPAFAARFPLTDKPTNPSPADTPVAVFPEETIPTPAENEDQGSNVFCAWEIDARRKQQKRIFIEDLD